jgi:hypothetical protein
MQQRSVAVNICWMQEKWTRNGLFLQKINLKRTYEPFLQPGKALSF